MHICDSGYFSADRPNCATFPSLKCAHISLWVNPTGQSKFHNISNHTQPATDSGRTARTPLYPPVQAVPPYSLPPPPPCVSCPGQKNHLRPVPVPMTGVHYNSFVYWCFFCVFLCVFCFVFADMVLSLRYNYNV